jgi:hypothetical protein
MIKSVTENDVLTGLIPYTMMVGARKVGPGKFESGDK